jgi:hypothetical protein
MDIDLETGLDVFQMNNRHLQRIIYSNFNECGDIAFMALNSIYYVIEDNDIDSFTKYKEKFIPFSFSNIEIDYEYTKIKNNLNLDIHKYIRDIIICDELKKINKDKTATIIYCRLLNDLFSNKYDKNLLKYMKETIYKLKKIT